MEPALAQSAAKALAAFLTGSPGAASREALLASQARSLKAALQKCRDPEGRQEIGAALAQIKNRLNPPQT
jgi:hypothetical protein